MGPDVIVDGHYRGDAFRAHAAHLRRPSSGATSKEAHTKLAVAATGVATIALVLLTVLQAETPASAITTSAAMPVLAQEHAAMEHPTGSVQPLVDGSENPELISDSLALRTFFLSTAMPVDANPLDLAQRDAKLGRLELLPSDRQVLVQALGGFHERLTAQRAQVEAARAAARQSPSLVTWNVMVDADNQISRIVEQAYYEMISSMSHNGTSKVREHLDYIKTRIKLIPDPAM